jgi:hypothetical protein
LRLYIVIPGALLALAGGTFTVQGLGIVGPPSSFMYQSGTWIIQGIAVFLVGVLVVLAGVWLGRPKRT